MKKSRNIVPDRSVDVRPLNQRESKLDTRKGIKRVHETVNVTFLENQQKLFKT
jgi:hypothetical protein